VVGTTGGGSSGGGVVGGVTVGGVVVGCGAGVGTGAGAGVGVGVVSGVPGANQAFAIGTVPTVAIRVVSAVAPESSSRRDLRMAPMIPSLPSASLYLV
jgi:hypothetical protein